MKEYDVIILGSGLGGLECGYILSKRGFNVCILEKNAQIGGCLQTFKRGDTLFDTGFHYVGGLDEGQFLNRLFRYFDLLDLPWHKMDEDGFAEVVVRDESFLMASGYERFTDTLSGSFPRQHRQLKEYTGFLRQVGESIHTSFMENRNAPLFEQSAYSFLQRTIDDPLLRDVLSGSSLTMELCKEKLPLYVFAQINSSFIQSAWRLRGGGSLIAERLAEGICRMGGTIMKKSEATRFVEKEGRIVAVEYNGEERVQGKYVISDIHPAATLALMGESKLVRKSYSNRMLNLENTYGMFTVHLQLKEGVVPYINRNIFIHKGDDLWDCSYCPDRQEASSALISFQVPIDGESHCRNIDILTPMPWECVEEWEHTALGKRGEGYLAFKQRKAEEMMAMAAERVPGLKGGVERYYTSTPLTYRDYTATRKGSAYGIRKEYDNTLFTVLSPNTPVPNLFLTGQNLNLHGILGVSMTSFFTCAQLTGMEGLVKDLMA